ncbi:MAG: hypothetical protein RSA24_00120 [Clostridia bacterium]
MPKWIAMLLCLLISIGAIALVEVIKCLSKLYAKKKGKAISMKKAEYPIALFSAILNFSAIFVFLYFGKFLDIGLKEIITICGIFASGTQSIYLFIVQIIRKGFVFAIHSFTKLISVVKKNKNPTEIAIEMIDTIKNNDNDTAVDTKTTNIDDFLKTIK